MHTHPALIKKYGTDDFTIIKVPVVVGRKSPVTGTVQKKLYEFIVDNDINIIRELENVTLIDMALVEKNPALRGKPGSARFAIYNGPQTIGTGSIPKWLFGMDNAIWKDSFDLRRENFS